MSSTPGKTEYKLQYNDRGSLTALTGPAADARRIQNVLFGHVVAGDADFGIDLQSYLMELSSPEVIGEIESKVSTLIKKYCPDVRVNGILIDLQDVANGPVGRGTNTLIIGISIGTENGQSYDFALVGSRTAQGTVTSTLIL